MENKSGIESLMDALKQSGVDFDEKDPFGGSNPFQSDSGSAQQSSGSAAGSGDSGKAGSRGAGGNRGAGFNPFAGIPGFGGGAGGPFAGGEGGANPFGGMPFGGGRGNGGNGGKGGNGSAAGSRFMDNLVAGGKKAIIPALILLIVILAAAYWWFHPPINIHSVDTWTFLVIFILLPIFLFFRAKSALAKKGTAKKAASEGAAKGFKYASFIPVAVVVVGLIGGLMSLVIFPGNAAKYSSILETQNCDFATDIQEVNYKEIPVIDRNSAILLGNREMGSIPEYVSQFEVDELYSQINYKQTPYRVSPLNYADLFKWLTNREQGLPAYALVDMTTQNADIVRMPEGQGIHYSTSEPLVRNIDRHVQLSFPFYMFDEKSFEIDEDGHPWWICPVQTRTIGLFGGTTINRVVLCDAVTGECQDVSVEECPQWVDRVFPADLLLQQYNWYGAYSNGWLNAFLGQQGVVRTTPGADGQLGYNYIAKDDDVWVYTGVTSATADNSIVGFVLVNQRTAESHYYSVAGATEESAMQSAEGQVQNLRYTSTFPLLINVANQPTYFMALKDGAGLVKKFAMIDIQRYQNVAVGDTVAESQASYLKLLATNGVDTSGAGGKVETKELSGTIEHMAQAVISGNTHYYVKLKDDKVLYDFGLPELMEILGYSEGDKITFSYVEAEGIKTVKEIKNSKVEVTAPVDEGSADGSDQSAEEAAA